MNRHLQQSMEALTRFREQVISARRQAGYLQKDLAAALALDAETLSRKLHGRHQAILTLQDVKQIIKTLAAWQAITTRAEALELLGLLGFSAETFSQEEWNSLPLSRLEQAVRPSVVLTTAAGVHPVRAVTRTSSLLPAATTPLIGREQAVQVVIERLRQPEVRLLTLLGPGGVGKTRLAFEVARSLNASFADGVSFVPLASLHDPALLLSRILEACGLLEDANERFLVGMPRTGLNLLIASLTQDERLLVLDNFEHLLEASTVVAELLAAAPRLKVLVTSRGVLHLYGEHIWEVPPLELVDPRHLPDLASLVRIPAIRLFVERAQMIKPAFRLTEHNAAAVTELCTRLDGLPLAIELAAAHIKLFSPQLLLEQLRGRDNGQPHQGKTSKGALTFLRQKTRDAPERQQTLWMTMDWSYQLLDHPAQQLLTHLGVFQGGWTVEAARDVSLGEPQLYEEMLDRLEALVNQSLIVHHSTSEHEGVQEQPGRFSMLELVRGYALARLSESGNMEHVQRRHAEYYLALVEGIEPDLYGGGRQRAAMRSLEREQDNIAAALAFAIEQGKAEIAQRFCCALFLFWGRRDQAEEGLNWLEATMSLGGEMSLPRRRKLVLAKGWLLMRQGAYGRARTLLEESFNLSQDGTDPPTKAFILRTIGESWYLQGEYAQAASSFEAYLDMYRTGEDQEQYAHVLTRLGVILQLQRDESRAESMLSESVTLMRAKGQRTKLFIALAELSNLEGSQGKLIQALEHMREALLIVQEIGYRPAIGPTIALALIECASYLGRLGAPERAAQIGGAAEALLDQRDSVFPDIYYRRYISRLEELKVQAEEAKCADWWVEGRALSQEQGIMLALQASQEMLSHQEISSQ